MWAQRSKQLWLQYGDQSTKYFHAVVKERRARNRINSIKDAQEDWIFDQDKIMQIGDDYFSNLFKSDPTGTDIGSIKQFIQASGAPKLNNNHLNILSAPFTALEIENAVFHFEGSKAPGPDGFSPLFYQHFWPTITADVNNMVSSFLQRGHILRELNQTNIVLIPKKQNSESFKDF